ncbi:DUF1214 domain-containing protein, partial [Flavobacterium denitrificans]|uniref:DUF1214 domain-containing protein n=1 Tax=Flavobacterium denitrificans TaxID=281361 RepID=UPI00047B609B
QTIVNNPAVTQIIENIVKKTDGNVSYNATTQEFSYTDANGDSHVINISDLVKLNETVTTVTNNGSGSYTYKNEAGTDVVINVVNDVADNFQTIVNNPAAKKDPALKKAMIEEAHKADKELVDPLLQFRNWGIPLPGNWTTADNCAAFGTDYFTRTAIAKSNILVNAGKETKYFYQDLDSKGSRLNGSKQYTLTFAKGNLPPVDGFWSLTLYDKHHFFYPNAIKRYSVGTKNRDLKYNVDGSLTLYVQHAEPQGDKKANWLPSPAEDFCLYFRCYGPKQSVIKNQWTPPSVVKI